MFEWIKSGFGPAIRIALLLACVFQPIALPAESVAVRYREGLGRLPRSADARWQAP